MNTTSMNNHAISLSNLTVSHGTSFILGPINCVLEPGTVTALVGPNGSGKSTLFRTMMNYHFPDGGEINYWGLNYSNDAVEIKSRLGYVPELSELDQHGKHLRDLSSFMSHWYPTWDTHKYNYLAEHFELEETMPFKQMSKGSQRKASLILAMSHNPELLLLDEPSSGLDPFATRKMIEEITHYMEEPDRTVLIATHSMDEVRRLADFVLFMYNGKQIGYYEKDALIDDWRSVWVQNDVEAPYSWPGVLHVENGGPIRVITNKYRELLEYLDANRIAVIKTETLELEEILLQLLIPYKEAGKKSIRR
ncbi:ABC transporter ATP-binding protein [Paenibacillus senegalensis]|uniref:ABC transporter ATP-binding protein n=1 Tax=Paenibacillus senegalensis TaxID=1465766 RepID=UPI000287C44C|nr:ABC transporter ATP-binding protein [Paenibacillus senegalensis]